MEADSDGDDLSGIAGTAFTHAPIATLVFDANLRVVRANDACRVFGPAEPGTVLELALPTIASDVLPLLRASLDDGAIIDRSVVRPEQADGMGSGLWHASTFPVDGLDGSPGGVGLFLVESDVESLARLDVTLAAGGLVTWDLDMVRMHATWGGDGSPDGSVRSGFEGIPDRFLATVHPADREAFMDQVSMALRTASDLHVEVRVARDDGETQWVELRGRMVSGADGAPRRMVGVLADVTDRHQIEEVKAELLEREHAARIEAEAARERFALMAEVGAGLGNSLDPVELLESLPNVLVPRFCDWCVVDILADHGGLEMVALRHAEPDGEDAVHALRRYRRDAGGDGLWSIRRSVRSGISELVVEITDTDLASLAVDDEHLALMRRLAPRSALTVPLIAQGQVLGGITAVATHDRRFERDDMTLLEEIAARVAMAVDNARLFESRTQVARALQQTLLPPGLPEIPGVEMAARYRVAADGIDIGGDFYDAFPMNDGSWALVIGDVCGKGAEAAGVTGLFRHTLRAVARSEQRPEQVLRATNDAILGRIDDTRFCTAVFVALRPTPDGALAAVACGGHPRPIVVRRDGSVERAGVGGTLLGVLPDPTVVEVETHLAPGDAMVLFTDGVTEARRGSELFGEEGLVAALEEVGAGGETAAALADRVERAIDAFTGGVAADDVAVLVMRVEPCE